MPLYKISIYIFVNIYLMGATNKPSLRSITFPIERAMHFRVETLTSTHKFDLPHQRIHASISIDIYADLAYVLFVCP